MIRQITLTNWRAYERLNLELVKPVTFIVAPNGVGKTSLMEAVRWAVFGEESAARKGRSVRVGEDQATVQVSIQLPSGAVLDVTRTLKASGKSTFRCSRGDHELSEPDYKRALSDEWAADPQLLAVLLFGEAGTGAESAFPIRDHLAEVMGVTPLIGAVTTIDQRLRVLSNEIKGHRAEGTDAAAIKTASDDAQRARASLSEAEERLSTAKAEAEKFLAIERSAEAWGQYRAQAEEYRIGTAALLERLSEIAEGADGDPEQRIIEAEEEARRELDRRRTEAADTRVRSAASTSALELLGDHPQVCPTCLRPLSDEELARAIEQHKVQGEEAKESIHVFHDALEAAERRISKIRELGRELRAVRLPEPPDHPEPAPAELEQARLARQKLLKATEAIGAARARADDASARLEGLKRAAEEDAALVAAYREEAVLQIAKDALETIAERFLTQRIQPLTEEVSRRWKLLFASEGLRLEPDGSLRLQIGTESFNLGELSGGERVVALFIARLLIVASATRATTLWLDEPLEHLDPRRRAGVARTIVKAAQQQALAQVVVTTYEERIAQTLAITAPDTAAVAYVRATPPL